MQNRSYADDMVPVLEQQANEDDEEHLSYLIWLRSEIKDDLNYKKKHKIIEEANKSIKH